MLVGRGLGEVRSSVRSTHVFAKASSSFLNGGWTFKSQQVRAGDSHERRNGGKEGEGATTPASMEPPEAFVGEGNERPHPITAQKPEPRVNRAKKPLARAQQPHDMNRHRALAASVISQAIADN